MCMDCTGCGTSTAVMFKVHAFYVVLSLKDTYCVMGLATTHTLYKRHLSGAHVNSRTMLGDAGTREALLFWQFCRDA